MALIRDYTYSQTAPRWAADYGDRESLVPGGAKLVAADFPVGEPVLSGTLVGRSIADRDAGVGFGPASTTAGSEDAEIYLLFHDVTDLTIDTDATLYRHGRIVKENFLPGPPTAEQLAVIRDLYTATVGAD